MLALHQGLVGLVIIILGLLSFFCFDIKPMQLISGLILIIGLYGNLYRYMDDLKEQHFKYLWVVLLWMLTALCYTIILSFISIVFLSIKIKCPNDYTSFRQVYFKLTLFITLW